MAHLLPHLRQSTVMEARCHGAKFAESEFPASSSSSPVSLADLCERISQPVDLQTENA
jgi:hypothetical protein